MRERQRIHDKKARGEPPPWTNDEILQGYRFTCIYREQDRVTRWIDANVRRPYARDPDLWFMLCLSRAVNEPATVADLIAARGAAWPRGGRWSEAAYRRVLAARRARGLRYANPAYLTVGVIKWMGPLWRERDVARISVECARTMECMYWTLRQYRGMGPFIACQVVADMRFTRYLRGAPDALAWTAPGPGSSRGMNRMLGLPLGRRWRDGEFAAAARELYRLVAPRWRPVDGLAFELHEIENSLCEFDKYERAKLGEGRPKQRYRPPMVRGQTL